MKTLILAIVAALLLAPAVMAAVPTAGHVYIVVEENHSYSSVIGNSAMPYLNSLVSKYALATKYYANTHPSIGNYFMLTTGQILTNNDSYMSTVPADNLVRHLLTAGKTWKSYAESLPYAGYTGGNTGAYVRRHNPFSYFSDVVNSSVEKMNLVPFTEFATDRANGRLPELSYVVPNIYNDGHNGTLAQADYWLKTNIGPLVASTAFQQSNDLLVIVFDESYDTDTAYGGGHVAMVVVGPKVRKGYKSTTLYQHQSTLRLISQALGLTTFPGKAAYAPTMGEFFGSSSSSCTASTVGVTICSPLSGTQSSTTVKFSAAALGYHPISSMMIYVDNTAKYTTYSASLSTSLTLSAGSHSVTIKSWDNTGQVYAKSASISVP